MKKVLLTSLGVMVALAMVLTACQDPTDFTYTNREEKVTKELEAPNVTAWAYAPTGYIRVTWDPVPNATGYEVYRRTDLNGKTTVKFLVSVDNDYADTTRQFYYEDIIDYDNEDITGSVTYKVVAYSDWSSNPKAAAGTVPWTNSDVDWFLLQNNAADSNRVTLSGAPAPGSKIAAPKNLKVSTVKNLSQGVTTAAIQLTWDVEPGVDYYVNYGVGGGELAKAPLALSTAKLVSGFNDAQKTAALVIPQIGKTYIEVVASHQGAAALGNAAGFTVGTSTAAYYSDSDPATITAEGPAPGTFGEMGTLSVNQLGNRTVQLSWKKVLGATGYKVYRFITSATGYLLDNGITLSSGVAYEEWKEVTGLNIITADGLDNVSTIDTLTTLYDGDSGINGYPSKNFFYVVVATGPNNTVSAPSNAVYASNQITVNSLSATNLYVVNTNDYDRDTKWPGIQLNWLGQTYSGVTHEVYRAEVTYADGVYGVVAEGDYEALKDDGGHPNTVVDGAANNQYGFIDKPPVRKSWRYRLDTIAADGTVINSEYQTINDFPYVNTISIPLYNGTAALPTLDGTKTPPDVSRPAYLVAYQIVQNTYQLDRLNSLLLPGEVINVYRVKLDAAQGNVIGDYSDPREVAVSTDPIIEYPGPGFWKYIAVVEGVTSRSTANTPMYRVPTVTAGYTLTIEQGQGNSMLVKATGNGVTDNLQGLKVTVRIYRGDGLDDTAALDDLGKKVTALRYEQYDTYLNTRVSGTDNEYSATITGLSTSTSTRSYMHNIYVWVYNDNGTRNGYSTVSQTSYDAADLGRKVGP